MASHFISKLAAVLAGGAMALFATAALAQDCANGRCGGAWVSAAPGYEFAPPAYAAAQSGYAYQNQYQSQAGYGAAYGYAQPAPQPYPASPC